MKTSVLKPSQAQQLSMAGDVIRNRGVVAYPTESCFGLGCLPKDHLAVKKILALKRRPASKGLILIAGEYAQLKHYIQPLPEDLKLKMVTSWPSATTWLVPAASWVPSWLKGDSHKIALRIPAHGLARRLCNYCGHALVSTSANRSGQRAARSADQVNRLFAGNVDYVVDSRCGTARRASRIIDLLTDQVLRA